jgi:hypothetical protein
MTTAGLEPATFWCRWRSKPNALPLRQVALGKALAALYMAPFSLMTCNLPWQATAIHIPYRYLTHTSTINPVPPQ